MGISERTRAFYAVSNPPTHPPTKQAQEVENLKRLKLLVAQDRVLIGDDEAANAWNLYREGWWVGGWVNDLCDLIDRLSE